MMQQKIRTLCFAGTTFAGDHNALIAAFPEHRLRDGTGQQSGGQHADSTDLIRGVGDRKNVWRKITQSAILVQLNILRIVNGIEFERVNGDENGAHISVNMAFLKTGFQILQ